MYTIDDIEAEWVENNLHTVPDGGVYFSIAVSLTTEPTDSTVVGGVEVKSHHERTIDLRLDIRDEAVGRDIFVAALYRHPHQLQALVPDELCDYLDVHASDIVQRMEFELGSKADHGFVFDAIVQRAESADLMIEDVLLSAIRNGEIDGLQDSVMDILWECCLSPGTPPDQVYTLAEFGGSQNTPGDTGDRGRPDGDKNSLFDDDDDDDSGIVSTTRGP